jgi:hypothetical protein
MLRRAVACPALTRQLIWTTLEEMQLEIGVSTSFLSHLHEDLDGPVAVRSWIASTWRLLLSLKIEVMDPSQEASASLPRGFLSHQGTFFRLQASPLWS